MRNETLTRIAMMLRLTPGEAKAFCDQVKAACPSRERLSEFDIVRALACMDPTKVTVDQLSVDALSLRAAVRGANQRRKRRASEKQELLLD
jgi:hypothetical protein